MEARWQIETQGPTRARHGGRAEKNKHGVDTVGLLMEAEFGQIGPVRGFRAPKGEGIHGEKGIGPNNGDPPKIRRYAKRVIERSRQLSEYAVLTK
jgi:hypothetical protein